MSPADFRVELHDQGGAPVPATDAPQGAPDGAGGRRRGRGAAAARPSPHRPPRRPPAAKAQGEGAKAKAAKPAKAAPADKPTPRAGTKQASMIEMLKRPEGATVEQIAAATGWQHHTIRGAISGALKKKLGLTVEATRTREVGPNKTGAKGSSHGLPDRRLSDPTRHRLPRRGLLPRRRSLKPVCAGPLLATTSRVPLQPISVSSPAGQFRRGAAAVAVAFWTSTNPRVLF